MTKTDLYGSCMAPATCAAARAQRPAWGRSDRKFPSVAFKIDTPEARLTDGGLTACRTLTLGGTSASPPTMDSSEELINCIMLLPEGPMHGHGARPTSYVWMGRQGICAV